MNTILSQLNGVLDVNQALGILMTYDKAMEYPAYNKSTIISESQYIARELCGLHLEHIALDFMLGNKHYDYKYTPLAFFSNISFNNDICIPMVLRAINLRLSNIY